MSIMSMMAMMVGMQAVSSISGSISQAGAINSQSAYESQQLEMNSRLADLQARSAERIGREESQKYKTKTKQLIGRQRALMAAQGIDISSGTALDIQVETAELGALDALTIRNNAFREATGYRIEAAGHSGRAAFTRSASKYRARNTLISGGLSAINQGFQTYAMFKGNDKNKMKKE